MLRGLVIGVLLLGPAISPMEASAQAPHPRQLIDEPGDAMDFGFVAATRPDGLALARQVLPPSDSLDPALIPGDRTIALAQSRIVYLNKNGVTLAPGTNDARTNRSTIVQQQTAIAGWNASPTVWAETVSCMRDLFARFDVQIVETDPGNVPHIEAVFGGTPTQLGMDPNVAGVSPFTLDCSVIENSVVFTFTNSFNFSSREACEIMAQEVAHSYGLDHQLLASDPMTYLNYNGNRAFQDQTSSCGESTQRPCGINGSVCRPNQNSVQLLRERLGTADAIAPTVAVMSPANNATVPPGFEVRADGTDNLGVSGAALLIDGELVDEISGVGPYTFTTPSDLGEGPHVVVVEVSDGKNIKAETRNVIVKIGAPPPDDDDGTGNGGEGGTEFGEVSGGCSTGTGGTGALWALGLALVLVRRRRTR